MPDEAVNPYLKPRQAAAVRRVIDGILPILGMVTCTDELQPQVCAREFSEWLILSLSSHASPTADEHSRALRGVFWALADCIHGNTCEHTQIIEPNCAHDHGLELRYQAMHAFVEASVAGRLTDAMKVVEALWDGSEGHGLAQAIDLGANVLRSAAISGPTDHGVTGIEDY